MCFYLPSGGSCQIMAPVWTGPCEEQPCPPANCLLFSIWLCTQTCWEGTSFYAPITESQSRWLWDIRQACFQAWVFYVQKVEQIFRWPFRNNTNSAKIKNTKMLLHINWCKFGISFFMLNRNILRSSDVAAIRKYFQAAPLQHENPSRICTQWNRLGDTKFITWIH